MFLSLSPLFNKAAHIQRALDSILNQSVQDYEIIVVDDGSTDEGAAIVKSITDPRIMLVQQENAGVSAARNRGIRAANNCLVAFLDADDEWKPAFLETCLSLYSKYPQAGAFGTAYEFVLTNGIRKKTKFAQAPKEGWEGILPNFFRSILKDFPFNSSSVMVHKEILEELGGFPIEFKLCEDLDLWVRIALKYPIAYSNTCLSLYHLNAENRTSDTVLYDMEIPVERTIQKALKNEEYPTSIRRDLETLAVNRRIVAAHHAILNGAPNQAKLHLSRIPYKRRSQFEIFGGGFGQKCLQLLLC